MHRNFLTYFEENTQRLIYYHIAQIQYNAQICSVEFDHARGFRVVDIIKEQELHGSAILRMHTEIDAVRCQRGAKWIRGSDSDFGHVHSLGDTKHLKVHVQSGLWPRRTSRKMLRCHDVCQPG